MVGRGLVPRLDNKRIYYLVHGGGEGERARTYTYIASTGTNDHGPDLGRRNAEKAEEKVISDHSSDQVDQTKRP